MVFATEFRIDVSNSHALYTIRRACLLAIDTRQCSFNFWRYRLLYDFGIKRAQIMADPPKEFGIGDRRVSSTVACSALHRRLRKLLISPQYRFVAVALTNFFLGCGKRAELT